MVHDRTCVLMLSKPHRSRVQFFFNTHMILVNDRSRIHNYSEINEQIHIKNYRLKKCEKILNCNTNIEANNQIIGV
jgi:hypothetical protein